MSEDEEAGLGSGDSDVGSHPCERTGQTDGPIPPTTRSSGAPPDLDLRDRETVEALSRLDSGLGGLLRLGHELLPRIDEPGVAFLVAHIGRELANGVERHLAGEDASTWNSDDRKGVDKEKNRSRIAAVLSLPPDHELVSTWLHVKRTLVAGSHYRAGPIGAELRSAFVECCGLLYGRIGPFFSTSLELDRLADADPPTADQVIRARSLLLRSQQRYHFFSKLAHVSWLQPLAKAGQFGCPPSRTVYPDGSWSPQLWFEGSYLARVAPRDPEGVVSIARAIPLDNDNPAVWSAVVDIGLNSPTAQARLLVPSLTSVLRHAPAFVFHDKAIDLVRHLAANGESSAFDLADALLWVMSNADPTPVAATAGTERRTRSDCVPLRLSESELGRFLAKAIPALEKLDAVRTTAFLAKKL